MLGPMVSALIFYSAVIRGINLVLVVVALGLELFAFINCITQRAEAFPVVGSLPKGAWLAMTGGSVLLTLLFGQGGGIVGLFGMIALTVALVYVLDVRPALRDATEGPGGW